MSAALLLSLAFLALPPAAEEIDRHVQTALDRWQTPGLALVIVHNDRIVHLQGYGREALEAKAPVTADTVFPLASCSKPFTAALLAMLVDDGKLRWDDPVRKHLPDFQLKDPWATERATVRDLLCHRTGIGPHPLLWYQSPLSMEERIRKLALLEPDSEFRTEFHYQTVAFGAAGLAGERAAGKLWADLMSERVFEPLGMTSSSAVEPTQAKSLARPHIRGRDGVIRGMPRYSLKQPDPAGSVHSTARDLSRFLRMQLAEGSLDGKPLLSAARIRDLQQANVIVPMEGLSAQLNPETVQIGYGLGWIIQDYRGRKMILHGGAIDGFRSHLVMFPEAQLGIGILSNLDSVLCNFALANVLADRFLELKPRGWFDEIAKLEETVAKQDARRSKLLRARRPANAQPLVPLKDYVGVYEDPAYGPCEVTLTDRGLEVALRSMRSPLELYAGHLFLADEPPFRDAPFEFVSAADGTIRELHFLHRTFLRKAK